MLPPNRQLFKGNVHGTKGYEPPPPPPIQYSLVIRQPASYSYTGAAKARCCRAYQDMNNPILHSSYVFVTSQ